MPTSDRRPRPPPLLCWQRFEKCREKFEAVVGHAVSRADCKVGRGNRVEHSSQEASRKAQLTQSAPTTTNERRMQISPSRDLISDTSTCRRVVHAAEENDTLI